MSESKEENSYGNILKRLSAFGGIQIFNILISLVRGKFVALFLGPAGMGISSLYTSSTAPIQNLCGLGLNLAIVKEVAAHKEKHGRLHHLVSLSLKLLLFTGLLGALVCAVAAPFWSKITFGDFSHTSAYVWLSLFVGLSIGGGGLLAILQGLGEVKRLTKASLVGGLTGLFVGVPLYYFFGDAGIVPAMIALVLSTFIFYWISFRQATPHLQAAEATLMAKEEKQDWIKKMLSLGFILLVGSLAGQIVGYLINLFIRIAGSIEDVGLYQGANSITNQYIGMIVSALALDYFPRLSACCHDKERMREVVNRQTEIVMLVATPLIILLILTSPLIIRILLTGKFLVITPLMRWMGLGMFIQLVAFPLGYIYVAKEDKKAYIRLECVWANICWLSCSVIFYYLFGLTGLGISLVVRGAIDFIINVAFCRHRYGFSYNPSTLVTMIVSILLSSLTFISSLLEEMSGIWIMSTLFVISAFYSIHQLRSKLKKE